MYIVLQNMLCDGQCPVTNIANAAVFLHKIMMSQVALNSFMYLFCRCANLLMPMQSTKWRKIHILKAMAHGEN